MPAARFYSALAVAVLLLHALFILWVILGVFLTRSRPILRWLHRLSYLGDLSGIASMSASFDASGERTGSEDRGRAIPGGFLLHYLDKLVYPDISPTTPTIAGVLICVLNLVFYGWQI